MPVIASCACAASPASPGVRVRRALHHRDGGRQRADVLGRMQLRGLVLLEDRGGEGEVMRRVQDRNVDRIQRAVVAEVARRAALAHEHLEEGPAGAVLRILVGKDAEVVGLEENLVVVHPGDDRALESDARQQPLAILQERVPQPPDPVLRQPERVALLDVCNGVRVELPRLSELRDVHPQLGVGHGAVEQLDELSPAQRAGDHALGLLVGLRARVERRERELDLEDDVDRPGHHLVCRRLLGGAGGRLARDHAAATQVGDAQDAVVDERVLERRSVHGHHDRRASGDVLVVRVHEQRAAGRLQLGEQVGEGGARADHDA
mmetsp:Transcript_22261/g.57177  ORF Transcript_22261/g.57177 Transcript_22261/m.57177 type:complete len:320 (+) Transcript_22261:501-1460(+)